MKEQLLQTSSMNEKCISLETHTGAKKHFPFVTGSPKKNKNGKFSMLCKAVQP
jgi:hypothetical protein